VGADGVDVVVVVEVVTDDGEVGDDPHAKSATAAPHVNAGISFCGMGMSPS
jgi:hypothetical protein